MPVTLYISSPILSCCTVISFFVKVPVLSVKITLVAPKVSTADSFLTNTPTKYSITAIKSATLKSISKNKLLHFLEENYLQNLWIEVLNTLIIQQSEREIDLLTTSAKDRYERVLKRSPKLFQNIPHKYIANYLRVSPETLSRLLKKS